LREDLKREAKTKATGTRASGPAGAEAGAARVGDTTNRPRGAASGANAQGGKPSAKLQGLTFQDLIFKLQKYWTEQGCILQQPYDVEVGAGTMHPETFLRVLGPDPYRVVYAQPSRRPADGRYGENPNRLFKHTQLQVILKPAPANVIQLYLESLAAVGIKLKDHDVRFEEDNWEAPTLGAWGIGWQVLLDGLEITQFTYFQQCGGIALDPVPAEITYGLDRIAAYLQNVDNVYDVMWAPGVSYGTVRLAEEEQFSSYNFEWANTETTRKILDLIEAEAQHLLAAYGEAAKAARSAVPGARDGDMRKLGNDTVVSEAGAAIAVSAAEKRRLRFPVLGAYDLCLKCSHLFNILDARGAISSTERAAMIGRIRKLSCKVASAWMEQRGWAGKEGASGGGTPAGAKAKNQDPAKATA
jgi:glycyl-tRNA synthetase alpha chain